MKQQKQFEGTFQEYLNELHLLIPQYLITDRLSAFEECYDLGLTPQKSIEFIILGN